MPKFRKKPIVVDAVRNMGAPFSVETKEGVMLCKRGSWLITGVEGEKYPIFDSIFHKTYEPVDDEGNVVDWPE